MPYIFHVSVLVAGCYLFYRFFLGKETYFQLNRWVLVLCLVLSFSLPFLEIPQEWSLKPVVENEPIAEYFTEPINSNTEEIIVNKNSFDPPSDIIRAVPEKEEIEQTLPSATNNSTTFSNLSWASIAKYIYLIGLAAFAMSFLLQFLVLLVKIIRNPSLKDGQFRIVEMQEDKAPFSFWNYIFLNPAKYDWETYNQILAHEKIHASQKHTLDILMAEIVVMLQWFNPFAWFYRKAVKHNLEFLTDQKMLSKGNDATAYQMSLLKVAVPNMPLNLTTNYNQSILKKRILMMNAKKSSVRSSWKYFFILPLLGLSIICLNAVKTTAQLTEPDKNEPTENVMVEDGHEIEQGSEETTYVQTPASIVEGGYGIIDLGEEVHMYPFAALEGNWTGKMEGEKVCFFFKHHYEEEGHYWVRKACFNKSSLSNLPAETTSEFKITREAGTVVLNGSFKNNEGEGSYKFEESTEFKNYLASEGLKKVDETLLFNCFITDINKAYFAYLKNAGYAAINSNQLMALAVHNISQERLAYYLDNLKSMAYEKPTLDQIIGLQIHNVEMDYVKALSQNVKEKLTIDNIIAASIHDLDAEYIREFQAAGFKDLTFDNLIGFAIHDVDVDYIKALKATGLGNLTADQITGAAIHDVDADYIKEFQAAGFKDLTFDNLVGFAIHDIDVDFIQALKSAGLNDLTADQITAAGIHDVDADYIKAFQTAGFEHLDFDNLIGFAIHDVDVEYIKALQAGGLGNLTPDQITSAAIHDVDVGYIKEFQAAGFTDLNFDNLVGFAIHDVDVEYIQELKAAGLTDLSADEITGFAIHDVDADFINSFRKHGYSGLSNDQIVGFAIHDVDADFIKSIKDLGFKKVDANILTAMKIHNVDADFIKKARADGHTDLSPEQYIELKIRGKIAE